MFQTLDVIISLAIVFLILSMALKFFMSMIKRGLKTKAKVVSEEMKTFIGKNTTTYLIPYLETQAKYLNFVDVLRKPKKKAGADVGIRQLSKEQLVEVITDFREFLEGKDIDKVKETLKLSELQDGIEQDINKIKEHVVRLITKVENNYDNTLKRIAERYETLIVNYSILFGLIFAVCINADFFEMYASLSKNAVATEKLVAQASMISDRMKEFNSELEEKESQGFTSGEELKKEVGEKVDQLSAEIEAAGLNLGWNKEHIKSVKALFLSYTAGMSGDEKKPGSKEPEANWFEYLLLFLKKVMGLFISGLLISFGAPFWHEFLGAVTGVRRLLVGRARGTTS